MLWAGRAFLENQADLRQCVFLGETSRLGGEKREERKRNHILFCATIFTSVSLNRLLKTQQQQNSPAETQRPSPAWRVWYRLHQQREGLKEHGGYA